MHTFRHPRARAFLLLTALFTESLAAGDPADTWIDLPPLPVGRQEVGVAALGTDVYVVGGILADRSATGRVARFDTITEEWETLAPLPGNTRLHHIGCAAAGDKLYAVGGLDRSFRGVATVFAYDPDTDRWTGVASLLRARGASGVATLEGRIYAVGGQSGGTLFRDAEVYDPDEDSWAELPPMPTARNHLAAAGLDGHLFAISGRAAGLRAAVESFDPDTLQWTTRSAIPTARGGIAAAVLAGKIFVFGGEGNTRDPRGVFHEVESYHPPSDTWQRRPDMPRPRHGIGAAAVGDRIYIPGGAPVQGFGTTDVHDALTPDELVVEGPVFRRGDANGDHAVDVSDPVFILTRLFLHGQGFECEDAADADDNGAIELTDGIVVLDYLFRGAQPPPAPGPVIEGNDPTDDELRTCEGNPRQARD